MMQYYQNDITSYILPPTKEKTYRDRGDFYAFVDNIKTILPETQSGEIAFYTDIVRPFQ
ncbi:MAG: hypothetical protein LBH96_03900 [Candidatus Peribacteria bacterium]|jgi:hypothetical protein|nr:hypothetical protein [Candidatus Peribacteria bacterium]